MNTVSITEFKQNIGTYFDELISTKKPIYIKRRSHSAMIVSLDNLTKEEIKTIENIRLSKNFGNIEVNGTDWVNTFNKISGTKKDKIILG